jgi:hypothetical protein
LVIARRYLLSTQRTTLTWIKRHTGASPAAPHHAREDCGAVSALCMGGSEAIVNSRRSMRLNILTNPAGQGP